jgi:hypothetical protein
MEASRSGAGVEAPFGSARDLRRGSSPTTWTLWRWEGGRTFTGDGLEPGGLDGVGRRGRGEDTPVGSEWSEVRRSARGWGEQIKHPVAATFCVAREVSVRLRL